MRVFTTVNLAQSQTSLSVPKSTRSVNTEGKAAVFFLVSLTITPFADLQNPTETFNVFKKYGDFQRFYEVLLHSEVPYIPQLPAKDVNGVRLPPSELEKLLEQWLQELLQQSQICKMLSFKHFLSSDSLQYSVESESPNPSNL